MVVQCFIRKTYDNYWNQTETYEALNDYIRMNYNGLKDKIISAIADDLLTLLVHLGYLSHDFDNGTVRIPNKEVKAELLTAVQVLGWDNITGAISFSQTTPFHR